VTRSRRRNFEETALIHLDEIFRVARRFSGSSTHADDLTQETFLRAWESFDRFEPGTNCRAWLYRIFFRVLSASRHELRRELALFDDMPFDDARTATVPRMGSSVTRLDIERAFAALPIAFACVITLIDVEGLTYKEAAAALEVPIGTVMSRLHRARAELRALLAPSPRLVASLRGHHD
jgi:RNA polymerase sigma-70 factor (ECF subfamily)